MVFFSLKFSYFSFKGIRKKYNKSRKVKTTLTNIPLNFISPIIPLVRKNI